MQNITCKIHIHICVFCSIFVQFHKNDQICVQCLPYVHRMWYRMRSHGFHRHISMQCANRYICGGGVDVYCYFFLHFFLYVCISYIMPGVVVQIVSIFFYVLGGGYKRIQVKLCPRNTSLSFHLLVENLKQYRDKQTGLYVFCVKKIQMKMWCTPPIPSEQGKRQAMKFQPNICKIFCGGGLDSIHFFLCSRW